MAAAVKSALIGGLLTARRLELFGLKPVTNARKPWTFADAIDNFVEKLPSASMRAFANQFIDAVEDSVIEMGYVIAYTIDDFYLAQRTATESDQQPDRTVEILPNEEEVVQATDGICFKAIAPRTDVTGATSG